LPAVAAALGRSEEDVVALHSGAAYVVGAVGFSPGFPYLLGLPTELHLPRRSTPRPRVPAGSVAIAAGQAGVYPQATPGGWHLIGRTQAELFSLERDSPALLAVGDRVRFVRETERAP
jgi:inhibitor of KinA